MPQFEIIPLDQVNEAVLVLVITEDMNQTHLIQSDIARLDVTLNNRDTVDGLTLLFCKPLHPKTSVTIHNESTGEVLIPVDSCREEGTFTFEGKFKPYERDYPDIIDTRIGGFSARINFQDTNPRIILGNPLEGIAYLPRLPLLNGTILDVGKKLCKPYTSFTTFIEQVDTLSFFYDYYLNPEFPKVDYTNMKKLIIEMDDDIDECTGEAIISKLKKLPKVESLHFTKPNYKLSSFIRSETFIKEIFDMGITISSKGFGLCDRVTLGKIDGLTTLIIQYGIKTTQVHDIATSFFKSRGISIDEIWCEVETCYQDEARKCVLFNQNSGIFSKIIVNKGTGDCSVHIEYTNNSAKSARF